MRASAYKTVSRKNRQWCASAHARYVRQTERRIKESHQRRRQGRVNPRSAGEYYDAEVSLNYNGYRTRDPNIWRFLQSDPLGLSGGICTYAAISNSPLSYIDLLGL